MKRFLPFLSLTLLLSAYTTFSWFLCHTTVTRLIWLIVVLCTLLEALLLTTLTDYLRAIVRSWLRSDLGYFTLVIILAFLATTILVWVQIFGYILVVIATEMLARLDLRNMGFTPEQSLIILTTVSLSGLGLGWLASSIA